MLWGISIGVLRMSNYIVVLLFGRQKGRCKVPDYIFAVFKPVNPPSWNRETTSPSRQPPARSKLVQWPLVLWLHGIPLGRLKLKNQWESKGRLEFLTKPGAFWEEKCCKEIDCDHIEGFSCHDEHASKLFFRRKVPHHLKGLHKHRDSCKGSSVELVGLEVGKTIWRGSKVLWKGRSGKGSVIRKHFGKHVTAEMKD